MAKNDVVKPHRLPVRQLTILGMRIIFPKLAYL